MAVVVGDGGHARDILATLNPRWIWTRIPHHSQFFDIYPSGSPYPLYIGINNPVTRDKVSREIGYNDMAWVHPEAYTGIETKMGLGTHINYGAMMTRTTLGHHCTIAPGVHMAGDITIGDRVFIGIGATIGNLVTIGDDAIIGAGSVVLKDVSAGQKVLGVWA